MFLEQGTIYIYEIKIVNIYVGNLPYKISDDDLRDLFAEYGEVVSVSLIKDKMTGQSKGFGFVEMADASDAANAISGLNEHSFGGRNIKVNEAKPREERPRRDFKPRGDAPRGGDRGDRGDSRSAPRRRDY
ncbi:RNA recognition motif domain-containing protein [Thiofilum flexile]|uniref:RNA recognition motif domain-containing protein n=1 Tax=Thiofilum flexile TaxID=125627 RepID=UPI001FDECF57|nr:RNA-binding protein [Thiofilum flexile]